MWSIYLKPKVLVEGTEVYAMLQEFKHAANHDSSNYIFVDTHPEAVNPVLVSEFEYETTDELVQLLVKELFATDRSRAIHLSKNEASTLHKHPAWKLWCGNYEQWEDLEVDHKKVFGVGVDGRKALDTLKAEARENLKATLA